MDKEKFEYALGKIRFQLENVEGWLSSGDMESALIKAGYLVEAAEALKGLLALAQGGETADKIKVVSFDGAAMHLPRKNFV